jgi:hypothetical protein
MGAIGSSHGASTKTPTGGARPQIAAGESAACFGSPTAADSGRRKGLPPGALNRCVRTGLQ